MPPDNDNKLSSALKLSLLDFKVRPSSPHNIQDKYDDSKHSQAALDLAGANSFTVCSTLRR